MALVCILCMVPTLAATSGANEEGPATVPPRERPGVIAIFDCGINPYHKEFHAPAWNEHPSTYIPGFPRDARAVELTLDAPSYEAAYEADRDKWESLEAGTLYYFPGTRIVGAINTLTYQNSTESCDGMDHVILEQRPLKHGTLVAGAAAGATAGYHPGAAIVAVSGGIDHGLQFVADNAWIDIVSISFTCMFGTTTVLHTDVDIPFIGRFYIHGIEYATWNIAESGRLVTVGAGNADGAYTACPIQGPPWTLNVGYVSGNGTHQWPHNPEGIAKQPKEVLVHDSGYLPTTERLDELEYAAGTSISPRFAAYALRLIESARERLDTPFALTPGFYATTGPAAQIPATGPLLDGDLTHTELADVMRRSAEFYHPHFRPEHELPYPEEHMYLRQGYGWFDNASYDRAERILSGEEQLPLRPNEDAWHAHTKWLSAQIWWPILCTAISEEPQYAGCLEENPYNGAGIPLPPLP